MFKYFFDVVEIIPEGVGFKMFGLTHLLWLLVLAVIIFSICYMYKNMGSQQRRKCCVAAASLLLADELFKVICLVIGGNYRIEYLPLHLCSINIFVIMADIIRPGKLKREFLYVVCLPAATAALLFPTWSALPFVNFMHLHSFTLHMLLIVYPLMLVVGGDLKPDYKMLPKCALILLCMAVPIFVFNKLTGMSFFFLNGAGKGNPLSIFESWLGNPGYLLGILIILPIVCFVMHFPIYLKNKHTKHIKK